MEKILKEPLVHFLIIGGFLFLLYGFLNRNESSTDDYQILLGQSDINRLIASYQKNWGTPPDSSTLEKLIEEEIKSEIYYREALRMQLDHNDEIIRRRMKQKYEFLVKDLIGQAEPTIEELKQYYQENTSNYLSPKKISFSQIYFSPDKRHNAEADALIIFEKIKEQDYQEKIHKTLGDNFHLQSFYAERDFEAIWQLFGRDFAEKLFEINSTGWASVLQSGYGSHLVFINNIKEAATLPFESVQEKVAEDWKQKNLELYNDQLYENLKDQYEVVIE